MDANRRTNFIAGDGGFEAQSKKFDFATVPSKGKADDSQVKSMIDNLRVEHFKLGEEVAYKSKSSNAVGGAAKSA